MLTIARSDIPLSLGTVKVDMFVLLAYDVAYGEEKMHSNAITSGVARFAELSRLAKVGMFNKLLLECSLLNHACNRTVYARVPLYGTLGPDAVPFIVNHTELSMLFCGQDHQFHIIMDIYLSAVLKWRQI